MIYTITSISKDEVFVYTHKTLNAKPFVSLRTNFQELIWVEIKLNKKDTFLIVYIKARAALAPIMNN